MHHRPRGRDACGRALRVPTWIALLLAFLSVLPTPAKASTARSADTVALSAHDLKARIAAGEPIDFAGIVVEGELQLTDLSRVAQPIRCRTCHFTGAVEAQDVVFAGIVDLSGSVVDGELNLQGATFAAPFVFGLADDGGRIVGDSHFRLATFQDVAIFDCIQFGASDPSKPIDFSHARFLQTASFAQARFAGRADFTQATFGGPAVFARSPTGVACATDGGFAGDAVFSRATFEDTADFRLQRVQGQARFDGTTFSGQATFSDTEFERGATFALSHFAGLEARSMEVKCRAAAAEAAAACLKTTFQYATATGPVDFTGTLFSGDVTFSNFTGEDSVTLRDVEITGAPSFTAFKATDLRLDFSTVEKISTGQARMEILSVIEASARGRGDLDVANEAQFRRQAIKTDISDHPARKVARLVGYELAAGYFVRPLYPLLSFLALLLAFTCIRWWAWLRARDLPRRAVRASNAGRPEGAAKVVSAGARRRATRLAALRAPRQPAESSRLRAIAAAFRSFTATLGIAVRVDPKIALRDPDRIGAYAEAARRWSEYILFKALIALFLIALTASNATLREFVAAIWR
jgi:hypothetical protein